MVTELERQAIVDDAHLRMLPVFYWVLGGMDILFSLYGWIYVAYGAFFTMLPIDSAEIAAGDFPAFLGWFMAGIGAAIVIGFGVMAALKIFTGFWIRGRKHHTAILVIAGISCLAMPFGTIVGVFTFIVMLRPSVAALFAPATEAVTPPPAEESSAPEDGLVSV